MGSSGGRVRRSRARGVLPPAAPQLLHDVAGAAHRFQGPGDGYADRQPPLGLRPAKRGQEAKPGSGDICPGTLDPILHELEEAGLLEREEHVVEGGVRKYHRATEQAEAALVEAREKSSWTRCWRVERVPTRHPGTDYRERGRPVAARRGTMFWFKRKRFLGSYFPLISTRRAHWSPKAARPNSGSFPRPGKLTFVLPVP